MQKKFVTNLLLLIVLNLLIKPFWIFGIDRTVQNIVGAESYGFYFSLLNFTLLLNMIPDLGITNYNNRNIARHTQLLNKHLANISGLKIILATVYVCVSMIIALIIGYSVKQIYLLLFLILNQVFISFSLYFRSNLTALHLFRTDSFLSILDRTLMILLCSIILFTNVTGHTMRIEWFVYIQTFSYLLASLVIFGVVKHYSGPVKLSFNRSFFIIFLRKSYPYALLILFMSLYTRIDSVLIERLLPGAEGKTEAGIYAQAYRLLEAVSNFGVLFAGLLLPIFSRMLKQGEDIRPMLRFSSLLIIAPALLIAFSSWFFRKEIMEVLYHHHTSQSPFILGILMFTFISIATTYIFGTLLTAKGRLKQLNWLAGGGVLLNLLLNLMLIPHLMATGAAWAALATQSVMALSQVVLVHYLFHLNPDIRIIVRIIIYMFSVWILGIFCTGWQNWLQGYLTMLTGGVLLAFGTGLISLKTLRTILTEQ